MARKLTVNWKTKAKPKPVIIEVRGGTVVSVRNAPQGYTIIDWDDREEDYPGQSKYPGDE